MNPFIGNLLSKIGTRLATGVGEQKRHSAECL
jgi:hypothetical protein